MFISINDISFLVGRTISLTFKPLFINQVRKRDLQRLLKRLRATELPYCLDTINPKQGLNLFMYLNVKSPIVRDLEISII